jgi:hypothetical protein
MRTITCSLAIYFGGQFKMLYQQNRKKVVVQSRLYRKERDVKLNLKEILYAKQKTIRRSFFRSIEIL